MENRLGMVLLSMLVASLKQTNRAVLHTRRSMITTAVQTSTAPLTSQAVNSFGKRSDVREEERWCKRPDVTTDLRMLTTQTSHNSNSTVRPGNVSTSGEHLFAKTTFVRLVSN